MTAAIDARAVTPEDFESEFQAGRPFRLRVLLGTVFENTGKTRTVRGRIAGVQRLRDGSLQVLGTCDDGDECILAERVNGKTSVPGIIRSAELLDLAAH